MPKRSRISLDDLIAAAERGAAGLKIGKGRKVTDPTTEALTAECEALRLQVKLANEQAEHYKAEAIRLSDLLQDAQAERDELRLTNKSQFTRLTEVRIELREAQEQAEETDALNLRLHDLLVGVANALKGPPPDLVWHDWSDLPALAAALASKATHLQAEVERLMKEPDQPD